MENAELQYLNNAILVDSRWCIYTDGAWEIYDTFSGGDIPQYVFNLRDTIKNAKD